MKIKEDILNRQPNFEIKSVIDSFITDADYLIENYIISKKERYLNELLVWTCIPRKFF